MYHCFGCVIGTMSALASGAAIVLPNWTFDARATLQAVQAERATALYGVPAMFIAELGLPDFASYDLSSLRTGMMAGAPCPVEVMKRVMWRDALPGADHRLRTDRELAGGDHVVARRPA